MGRLKIENKEKFVKMLEKLELLVREDNVPLIPMGQEYLLKQDDRFLMEYYEELRFFVG